MTVKLCILTRMKEKEQLFTLDELAGLVDLPRRTVRYYIQIELIDRPEGVGRGAHYRKRHLEQLIEVRKWQQAGLSLERIRELLTSDASGHRVPPLRLREKGSVQVKSHLMIDEGVELTIDTTRSNLTPEKVRKFADEVMNLYEKTLNSEEL